MIVIPVSSTAYCGRKRNTTALSTSLLSLEGLRFPGFESLSSAWDFVRGFSFKKQRGIAATKNSVEIL